MDDRLEDTSDVLYSGSATDKAIISIAISLKRIADSLDGGDKVYNLQEYVHAMYKKEILGNMS